MYSRILIVVDAGTASRAAITEGVALAKSEGAEVLFFSVLPRYVEPVVDVPMIGMMSPEEFRRTATAAAERHLAAVSTVAQQAGVRSSYEIGSGHDDVQCILDAAKRRRCGLIAVASGGRNAVMRLLTGSVIPGLITQSAVPLLVVRKPSPGSRRRLGTGVSAPLAPAAEVQEAAAPLRAA